MRGAVEGEEYKRGSIESGCTCLWIAVEWIGWIDPGIVMRIGFSDVLLHVSTELVIVH